MCLIGILLCLTLKVDSASVDRPRYLSNVFVDVSNEKVAVDRKKVTPEELALQWGGIMNTFEDGIESKKNEILQSRSYRSYDRRDKRLSYKDSVQLLRRRKQNYDEENEDVDENYFGYDEGYYDDEYDDNDDGRDDDDNNDEDKLESIILRKSKRKRRKHQNNDDDDGYYGYFDDDDEYESDDGSEDDDGYYDDESNERNIKKHKYAYYVNNKKYIPKKVQAQPVVIDYQEPDENDNIFVEIKDDEEEYINVEKIKGIKRKKIKEEYENDDDTDDEEEDNGNDEADDEVEDDDEESEENDDEYSENRSAKEPNKLTDRTLNKFLV